MLVLMRGRMSSAEIAADAEQVHGKDMEYKRVRL
jgi:hypothetical protein